MTIELFGLPQEDKNAMLFAEAEMSAMSDAAEDTFRYLMNIVNVEMYSEAEGTKSNNIFAKIWGFIKSLVKSVITFIKKVAKETIRLILLPFSSKMKVAEAGGGAGSATARSEEPSTSNPMSTNYDNIKECNNMLKSLHKYITRFSLAKDVTDVEAFKNIKLSDIVNNGFIDNNDFKSIDKDKIYKPSDIQNHIKELERIDNMSSNIKFDKVMSYGEFVSKVKEKELKNHPVLQGNLNIIPTGKTETVEGLFSLYENIGPFINNIIEYCKVINGMSERVISEIGKNESGASYMSRLQINDYLKNKIKTEKRLETKDNLENMKLFGKPADAIMKLGRFLVLATGENISSVVDSKTLSTYANADGRGKYNINNGSFSAYKDTLTSKIYDYDINELFKGVKISGNLKELTAGELSVKLSGASFDKIMESLKTLTSLNENFFEAKDEQSKSAASDLADKIDTSVQAINKSTSAWRGLLSGVSKIIRNLGNQTIKVCSDIRTLSNNIEGLQVACHQLFYFNAFLYLYDYICFKSYELSDILDDNEILNRVYDGDQSALDKDKLDIKNILVKIQKESSNMTKQYMSAYE